MALQPSIDKEVNMLTDTYMKNPQGLEQRQRLDPSMEQAIALERVLELLKAEKNTIDAQMQTPPNTIMEQQSAEMQSMIGGGQNQSVADVGGAAQAKGIASAMPQSNQNMPKMASGGKVQKFQYGGLATYADKADKQTQVRNQDSTRDKLEAKKAALIEGVQKGTISATRARKAAADIDAQLQKLNTAITEQGAGAVAARRETAADNKSQLLADLGVTPKEEAPKVAPPAKSGIASVPVGTGTVLRQEAPVVPKEEAPKVAPVAPKVAPVAPKQEAPRALGGTSEMDKMAMDTLSNAMGRDSAKAGDDAYDKFLERSGASGIKTEYDRMRSEQDAVNERYARSPRQEARDRVFAFFANAGSMQSGVAGLSKAALADQELVQKQQERTQTMLNKSLELDKEFLTKKLGLDEKAAEEASGVQNNTDALQVTSANAYQNLTNNERELADKAAARELTREDSALARVHDRLMLALSTDAKYKLLTLTGKLQIQSELYTAAMEIENEDTQLAVLNASLAKQKEPDGKKAMALRAKITERKQGLKNMTAAYMRDAEAMIDRLSIDSAAGDGSDTMSANSMNFVNADI